MAVGVIVECVQRRTAIVSRRAIHAVAHKRELVRGYLVRQILRFRLQGLSPEEVVVHQFRSVLVVVKQRHVMRSSVFCHQTGSVCGVRLVVTRLHLLIVGDVAELTDAQIGYAGILARDGIRTTSILIIAVGIIVCHVFQNVLVSIVACKQIILVEVVRHSSETEVVTHISLVGAAVPTIHHRCGAVAAWSILEAAMIVGLDVLVRRAGQSSRGKTEVIDVARYLTEERIVRSHTVDDMAVAMQDAGKLGDVSAVLRRGCQVEIVLQHKLCICTIARSCTSIAY